MIGDLEHEWHVSLLERGRSGVRLTSDGVQLLPYARKVCGEYQRLQTQVDELNGLQGKGLRAEAEDFFEQHGLHPTPYCTTWDDYAIMSLVERGVGISLLPELILKRTPYHIVIKELSVSTSRDIGFALRDKKTASLAVKRFMEYLNYR